VFDLVRVTYVTSRRRTRRTRCILPTLLHCASISHSFC